LDDIENKIKNIEDKVESLKVSGRKKELIRDISQDLGKAKSDINKARGKQNNIFQILSECKYDKKLGDHPEMIKCDDKYKEQVERLKNVSDAMEKHKNLIVDKNNEIKLGCGHSFTKKEFADFICGLIDD